MANNPWFAEDLADKQTMVIFPESELPVAIDLTGTSAAMAAVRACQAAHPSRQHFTSAVPLTHAGAP